MSVVWRRNCQNVHKGRFDRALKGHYSITKRLWSPKTFCKSFFFSIYFPSILKQKPLYIIQKLANLKIPNLYIKKTLAFPCYFSTYLDSDRISSWLSQIINHLDRYMKEPDANEELLSLIIVSILTFYKKPTIFREL